MLIEHLILKRDNFYPDPMGLRKQALAMCYDAPPTQRNSGSLGPIAEQAPCDAAIRTMTINALRPVVPDAIASIAMEFRYVHTGTIKRQVCHADGVHLAGLVYLALPQHGTGSTVFFRHKPTGDLWQRPENRHRYDFRAESDWEEVSRVEGAFNRLILYPGELFHAIGSPYFGDSPENARLTQVFFMNLRNTTRLYGSLRALR